MLEGFNERRFEPWLFDEAVYHLCPECGLDPMELIIMMLDELHIPLTSTERFTTRALHVYATVVDTAAEFLTHNPQPKTAAYLVDRVAVETECAELVAFIRGHDLERRVATTQRYLCIERLANLEIASSY